MSQQAAARIIDRGYRRYEGRRLGGAAAVVTLAKHSLRRSLGLRRPARAKVLPFLTIAIAYLPAVVFIGLLALFPGGSSAVPSYAEYYDLVLLAIFLFTALVGPELLCPDRHSRVLGLYMASPLTRDTYLLAKGAAIAIVLGAVTLGPLLLLLVGYTLLGIGPDGIGDFAITLLRIACAGVVLSLVYGSVGLAVSSFTDRRAFASAGIVLVFMVTGIVGAILDEVLDVGWWARLVSLGDMAPALTMRIFGLDGRFPEVGTLAIAGAVFGWTATAMGLLRWRYQRLDITS